MAERASDEDRARSGALVESMRAAVEHGDRRGRRAGERPRASTTWSPARRQPHPRRRSARHPRGDGRAVGSSQPRRGRAPPRSCASTRRSPTRSRLRDAGRRARGDGRRTWCGPSRQTSGRREDRSTGVGDRRSARAPMSAAIGIDTGGTFTDMVVFDAASGEIRTLKTSSMPATPGQAIVNALAEGGDRRRRGRERSRTARPSARTR